MHESRVGGTQRVVTLLIVAVLHMGLVALLLATRTLNVTAATATPVELLSLPSLPVEPVRAPSVQPRFSTADLTTVTAPAIDTSSLSAAPAEQDSHGPPINWSAEAHRAVAAFEIRRDHLASHPAASASPWDGWWPHQKHRAGDQYKTASGDWIVWIDANCYQVASSHSEPALPGTNDRPTLCPAGSRASLGDASP